MTIANFQINGVEYVSYATVAEADAFLAIDPARGDAWNLLQDAVKQSRLAWATRTVDEAGTYSGERVDANQETEFPRNNLICDGQPVAETLPEAVVEAVILIAGTVAANPSVVRISVPSSGGTQRIKRLKGGTAELEYDTGAAPAAQVTVTEQLTPDTTADGLIRCFFAGAAAGASADIFGGPRSSGSSSGNAFGNSDRFRVN